MPIVQPGLIRPHPSPHIDRQAPLQPLPPFSFQANQKENLIADIQKQWDTVWEVFPGLSDNSKEPAAIPLIIPSTTCTSTSSTTHYSTSPVTRTTTSRTHPHTIGYRYTYTTTSSNSTPQIESNHPHNHPHNYLDHHLFLLFRTHHLPQTTLSKKERNLKRSSHVTITKRRPPTLDIFPFTSTRLKLHKKYILPLKQPQPGFTTAFPTNSKSSTSTSITTATTFPSRVGEGCPHYTYNNNPKEVIITWSFGNTTFEPAPLWNKYTSEEKITMPIKMQILSHIHKSSLFLLPTQTQPAFNATVFASNAPVFCVQLDFLDQKN